MGGPSHFPIGKTWASLFRVKLILPVAASAGLGLFLVILIVSGLTVLFARLTHFSIPWIDTLSTVLMGGVFGVAGWFMLPVLVVLIAGLFQDLIVRRVETAFYPEAMGCAYGRFWPDLIHDIRFTFRAVFLNVLILPFYFLAVGPFLSILLNSYLLGREFFETAASYHMNKSKARNLGRKNKTAVYLGGFLITIMTLIPVLNVCVPVFALTYMVHLFHAVSHETGGIS